MSTTRIAITIIHLTTQNISEIEEVYNNKDQNEDTTTDINNYEFKVNN